MLNDGTLQVVQELTLERALDFAQRLDKVDPGSARVVSCDGLSWAEPAGMLLTALALRRFLAKPRTNSLSVTGLPSAGDYLGQMGFYDACGIPHGRLTGDAPGGRHYMPITGMDFSQVKAEARKDRVPPQEVIERHAARLASMLTHDTDGPGTKVLAFCLTELLRNALEHAGTDKVWYAGQYWPGKEEVEIAIIDDGKGVAESLRQNPSFAPVNDAEGIHLAILPGVSRSPAAGKHAFSYDLWANSGYGLFMTSQIALQEGRFVLVSGTASLTLSAAGTEDGTGPGWGTLVVLRFRLTNWRDKTMTLADISRRGDKLAKKLAGAHDQAPMTASRLARELELPMKFPARNREDQ